MTIKISFNKAAGYRLENARQTVKMLFAIHDLPCVSENNILVFKDKGQDNDFAIMWNIILSLLRADWFLEYAASCVWQDEDNEEDVLSQVRKMLDSV